MVRPLALIVILGIIFSMARIGFAQENQAGKDFEFHGFAFWTLSHQKGLATKGVQFEHIWLVLGKTIDANKKFTVVLTPKGPPQLVHNAQFTWNNFYHPFIDVVTIGKFIPPFAEEFSILRIDQSEAVRYSRVLDASRLVARDTGVQVSGHIQSMHWDAATFTGDRTGSDIPASEKGKPDGYVRARVSLPLHGQIGFSQRIGPVPASAAEASLQKRDVHIAFEGIWVHGGFDYYMQPYVRLPHGVTVLYRFEDYLNHGYHTMGVSIKYAPLWLKLNVVYSKNQPTLTIGEFVVQW